MDDKRCLDIVLKRVAREFKVSQKELAESPDGKENLLALMAMSIALDCPEVSIEAIRRRLGAKSVEAVKEAPRRLQKYLQYIDGLEAAYRRLKTDVIKKADGF